MISDYCPKYGKPLHLTDFLIELVLTMQCLIQLKIVQTPLGHGAS